MATVTYFNQDCPTCGRGLRIRVEYQGKRVACQHCHAQFEACDPESPAYPPEDSGLLVLAKANELLAQADSFVAAGKRPR